MTLAGLRQRPAYRFYRYLWTALDWIFPPRCAGCDKLGERLCDACWLALSPIAGPVCDRCGIPLPGMDQELCAECLSNPPAFALLRSCYVYKGTVRKLVHRLKYQKDIGLGDWMAEPMLDLFVSLRQPIDLVTCVPLSKERIRQRGYNQTVMLARPIALGLNLPFQPLLLRKTREVPTQVGLSAHDRRLNVQDAFEPGGETQKAKRILIVDDVTTTGSTMNACARALIDAGAQQVMGLTFARAGLNDHNQPN